MFIFKVLIIFLLESSMDMDHSETESKRIDRGQKQRKLTETCLLLDPTRRKTPPKHKMTAKKKGTSAYKF